MWQSRSGVPKDKLSPASYVPIDFTTCGQILPLKIKPSDETPIHAAIYRLMPDVKSVVHAHPVNVLNFVKQQTGLVFANEEMIKAWSLDSDTGTTSVPVVDNTQDMEELAKELPYLLKPSVPVLVVRDHGVYAWGKTPKRALNHMEACEYLCRTQTPRRRS
jgi:methylthioribulose-1-phosphate dehydratase